MPVIPLYWNRCEGGAWGELFAVDFDDPHFDKLQGVFVVWQGGDKPAAIRVGGGALREGLKAVKADPAVEPFRGNTLLVSWAKADPAVLPGMEKYLHEALKPKTGGPPPTVPPQPVTPPGAPSPAQPDAGPPPRIIFQDLLSADATPEAGKVARPPAAEPVKVKVDEEAEALKLPLQKGYLDIVAKHKDPGKSGFFGGGAAAKPAEERLVFDIVQYLMREAIKLKASDIHLEPLESRLRVRYRLDGILGEVLRVPHAQNVRIVSHIRVMCGLDPEKGVGTGKPEDGRMAVNVDGIEADLRLSTFPTPHGDKAVLRIIPRTTNVPKLEEIGLSPAVLALLKQAIHRPQGMVVVTGPTGSGKSTTLYTVLQELNDPTRNIVTLEDPIEKKIPGISQGMIQPKSGFGFAEGLRAILRQDPNIIMVGEIRDLETAEIAMSASLTGHMLLTTLHTVSALGAITRLIDMGLEPFLVASALTAVSAQRLVRRVCLECSEAYTPNAAERAEIEERARRAAVTIPEGMLTGLKRGRGCDDCRGTGYSGRMMLMELLLLGPALRALILNKATLDDMKAVAVKEGMEPMISDGLRKAASGLTTLSEIVRVVDISD